MLHRGCVDLVNGGVAYGWRKVLDRGVDRDRVMEIIKEYGVFVVVGVVGVVLVGYGVWEQVKPGKVEVEIISANLASEQGGKSVGEIVVDVEGEVEKPGIYKLASGSRIGDALVVAGGLAANADREWVAATLNLAQRIEDGEKIYIPDKSVSQQISNSAGQVVSVSANSKMNLNTASVSELDSLEGIGEARAKAIIDNRPYSKPEEIVVKAKIPQSVYDKIKDSISVY